MVQKNVETNVEIIGINQLLRVLNKIPKELQNEIRDAANDIAQNVITGAQAAASTKQQRMVAQGLKVKRDRIPVVRMPATSMSGHRGRYTDVFYGAEFGGQGRPTTQQFPPHRGRRGYFLYPTARRQGKANAQKWMDAVDKAMSDWHYRPPT